jgi:hypothetical protein
MFDKVSQVAEKLATNVSRRAFLNRVGQGALVVAGVLGATLAFPGQGQAGKTGNKICTYWRPTIGGGTIFCYSACVRCDTVCGTGGYGNPCRLGGVSACTCNHDCSRGC